MATRGFLQPAKYEIGKIDICRPEVVIKYQTPQSCIGTSQSRSPEPSGTFVPGQFRVNPVVIRKVTGSSPDSIIIGHVANAAYPCGNYYYAELRGQFAAKNFTVPAEAELWDGSLAQWAIQDAYSKLNEPKVGAALMLAELTETVNMLRNPVANLTKLVNQLKWKRGIINPYMALGDFLSGSWLQFIYGVLPLMKDIQDIIDAISKGLSRDEDALIRFKGSASSETSSSTLFPTAETLNPFSWKRMLSETIEKKAVCTVYSKWLGVMNRSHDFGFDIRQVPNLLWEIVPYSFLVDWFVNVGSYLLAIMPTSDFAVLGNCVSLKTARTFKQYVTDPRYTQTVEGVIQSASLQPFVWKVEKLERRIDQSMSYVPAINLNVGNLTHAISAIALLWQQLPQSWRRRR